MTPGVHREWAKDQRRLRDTAPVFSADLIVLPFGPRDINGPIRGPRQCPEVLEARAERAAPVQTI